MMKARLFYYIFFFSKTLLSFFFNSCIAINKGFKLGEYSICPVGITGVSGDPIIVNSERDIFDILGTKREKKGEGKRVLHQERQKQEKKKQEQRKEKENS